MDPQYLLLVHSCVASSMLVAIFSYLTREQKTEATTIIGIPLLLFNIAWVSAIVAILSPLSWAFSFCLWLTAFAIFVTAPLLIGSILFKGRF